MFWPVHLWFWQFLLTTRGVPHSYIYNAIFQIIGNIVLVAWLCFGRFRPVLTAIALMYTFSLILQLFSYIYWSYGADGNFTTTLTHLDSFYFALGTLTTAGTGNIAPLNETTRGLQALQMGLDFALISFVVVLVLTRYSDLLNGPEAAPLKDTSLVKLIAGLTASRRAEPLKRPEALLPKDIPPIAPAADWSDAT